MSFEDAYIQVSNIGKCYEIYHKPIDRLKQLILPQINATLGRRQKTYFKPYWALKDISFELKKGDTLGIVGQNGSGKSTLLQIITGILQPTLGAVDIKGRVGALLELGSGFNPEFTGIENVFLNGSVLGFSKKTMTERLDDILAFADIGHFVHQPVKIYSTGMLLRLAFALQTAGQPNILVIDEALAVGDARFQLKCFKRLESLNNNGTIIILVSHSVETVRSFCKNGLLLNHGEQIYYGDVKTATTKYNAILFPQVDSNSENAKKQKTPQSLLKESLRDSHIVIHPDESSCVTFGMGGANIKSVNLIGLQKPNIFKGQDKIKITCDFTWDMDTVKHEIDSNEYKKNITVGIALADHKGCYLFGCNGFDYGLQIDPTLTNEAKVAFSFQFPDLVAGSYFLSIAIALGDLMNHRQLKWYDCLIELKCIASNRNPFGLMAIDYEMILIQHQGTSREQVTECAV